MTVGRINQLSDSRTKFDIEEVLREPLAPGQFSTFKAMKQALRALKAARYSTGGMSLTLSITDEMDDAIDLLDEEFDGVCMKCFGENDGPDIYCLSCEKQQGDEDDE